MEIEPTEQSFTNFEMMIRHHMRFDIVTKDEDDFSLKYFQPAEVPKISRHLENVPLVKPKKIEVLTKKEFWVRYWDISMWYWNNAELTERDKDIMKIFINKVIRSGWQIKKTEFLRLYRWKYSDEEIEISLLNLNLHGYLNMSGDMLCNNYYRKPDDQTVKPPKELFSVYNNIK